MQKWEYCTLSGAWSLIQGGKEVQTWDKHVWESVILDELGADGWELVSITITPHSAQSFYFKRPKI
jgi:hypothetical protein